MNSGYGVAWISLTDEPGDFTSYIVTVDSLELTGKNYGLITAISAPEAVDFTKLVNFSELWSSAGVPVDTYTSATITLDYTSAQIYVQVNGVPVQATVVDPTGAAVTTVSLTVNFDPSDQLTFQLTPASTNALRVAVDYDLAASNVVDLTTSPPTVTVKPYFTVATSASDSKLIRVRGPLVNSDVGIATYSTYVRPFFDEVNALGTLTIFNTPSTIYTLNGLTYVGKPGITALSQTSAGSTMTAAWCTFQPTATLTPGITAGIFYSTYVVAGSTLEDFYTDGMEGDVIARNGNVLTVRGALLDANADQIVQYQANDALITLGTATLVTADGTSSLPDLNYKSVSVGQHIIARGLYALTAANVPTLDSTGSSSTNTGSVRLQSTEMWGSLISSAAGGLLLNLQAINDWPVSNYDFAGNGATAAQDSNPASYAVNTGTLALPVGPDGVTPVRPGDLLWIDGFTSPFGTAPPDFIAESINAQQSVSATMLVSWTGLGTAAPFATLTDSGLTIDLSNAAFGSGEIRIGAQSIDITTLAATPQIIPQVAPAPPAGLPPVFLPRFSVGPGAIASITTNPVQSFNSFTEFVTQLNTTFATPTPATKFTARGFYNSATNTFTASNIDVVL
ncbi:MAG: hypothetical protein ACLPV8_26175 [Steroidobacteraceae bacterium]